MAGHKHDLQRTCPHPTVDFGVQFEELEFHKDGRPPTMCKHQHCYCHRCGMYFDRFVSRRPAEDNEIRERAYG